MSCQDPWTPMEAAKRPQSASRTNTPDAYAHLTPTQLYDSLPLQTHARCIRLLDISALPSDSRDEHELAGSLRMANLQDCPAFTALSYTWGSPSPSQSTTITCNGCRVPITPTCFEALTALRAMHGTLTIWVDAICINQDSSSEKNLQIPLMEEIYTWAQAVYIWLGPKSAQREQTIDSLLKISASRVSPAGTPWHRHNQTITILGDRARYAWRLAAEPFTSLTPEFRSTLWASIQAETLYEALGGEWIHRVWTFQEIILASNPILVSRSKQISWLQFQQALEYLHGKNMNELSSVPTASTGLQAVSSEILSQWIALYRVWLNIPRPFSWNGITFRSPPAAGAFKGTSFCSVNQYLLLGVNPSWVRATTRCTLLVIIISAIGAFGTTFFIFQSTLQCEQKIGWFMSWLSIQVWIVIAIHILQRCFWGSTWNQNLSSSQSRIHIVGSIRALRERYATEPKDQAFALYGILRRLGCRLSVPDYTQTAGHAFTSFFQDLIRWDPTLINLLLDCGQPLDNAPSWVPDWTTIQHRNWLPQSFVYSFLEMNTWPGDELEIATSEGSLWLTGSALGTVNASSSTNLPYIERNEQFLSALATDGGILDVVAAMLEWLANIRSGVPVPPGFDSIPQAVFVALSGRFCGSPTIEDDLKTFYFWYRIMAKHCAIWDGRDIQEASTNAFIDLSRNKRALNYMMRCYNSLKGKRGLFLSSDGYLGSGPPGMVGGDIIYILKGVATPMILRRQGNEPEKYSVVGAAFVVGWMDLSRSKLQRTELNWRRIRLI